MNRVRIAQELVKIAKLLSGFWDMKVVPPTDTDVRTAHKLIMGYLKSVGMNCDNLEFQRFLAYQENEVCNGPDCSRNSNKHLCIFGFSDKDGKFGGGVAGGRIGEANAARMKLYQKWGITGVGAEGERKLKSLIDAYIRKKTNQADAYTEVSIKV